MRVAIKRMIMAEEGRIFGRRGVLDIINYSSFDIPQFTQERRKIIGVGE